MRPFAALADDTRLQIVDVLAREEASVNDLVARFAISQPAISQHLKVLREAGLVRVRPEAQRRIYSLDPDGLREIDTWLSRYRRFWASRLDRLEEHMDAHPATSESEESTYD
ncbi:ArsR family transcriptional regulator [bacterium SCGC AG-212-C10]|nr:ArsR family transcriptional regulator [bacterium SCGC AG-212-C10]